MINHEAVTEMIAHVNTQRRRAENLSITIITIPTLSPSLKKRACEMLSQICTDIEITLKIIEDEYVEGIDTADLYKALDYDHV